MKQILKNSWLTAEFDTQSGNLVGLSDAMGRTAIAGCWCSYMRGTQPVNENPAAPGERFAVLDVKLSDDAVESVIGNDDIEVRRRFELPAAAPLLKVRYTVRARRPGVELARPIALPELCFAEDFLNPFEDEEDLYFDGEELGDGRELPPWRVFFRQGRRNGLIAATRCKLEMSRFQVLDRSFAIKPHVMTAYTTDYVLAGSHLRFASTGPVAGEALRGLSGAPAAAGAAKESYSAEFEIGPWRRAAHDEILRAAQLDRPPERRNPPLTGAPPKDLKGVVFRAADFAPASAVSETFDPAKWMLAALPYSLGGRALVCGCSVRAPAITLAPGLTGLHRVYAGIANGNGIVARFSGDPLPTFRTPHEQTDGQDSFPKLNPFLLRLSGPQRAREVLLKVARMDGQSIEFQRDPNSYAVTVLDYVRFEPLTPSEAAAWEETERREPVVELSGFNDIPDIERFTDPRDPDPAAYEANLWEHANCKVRKVYWRIDGQCSDYASKLNTMRYVCARVHGVFTPQCKAYGRVLKKTDMLALAVAAARRHGLKLYGWMRFNNYSGNVQSDFFVRHPELHEANDRGAPLKKLCLAHEAVRAHKIGILCEAAAYGLDGLCLGFLRHPPVLHYAPVLVEGFRARHGAPPPPEPDKASAERLQTRPEEEELRLKWYRHRAQYLTLFGRELRAALKAKGLGAVKLSIWVRHDRCLYDGIDLDAWLDEGLCDEVVAASSIHGITANVSPEWRRKVQARVPLIHGVSGYNIDDARAVVPTVLRDGYSGICTYESDYSVVDDVFIEYYRGLRGARTDTPGRNA
jgi:hypothetical protein